MSGASGLVPTECGHARPLSLVLGHATCGFTMIEIALCLAIIGFALVAIIGVLPIGMNVQKDNREETIVNQDATMLMDAISTGARGFNDLTNYVYMISNSWALYNSDGTYKSDGANVYTYNTATIGGIPYPYMALTNGANIIGLLSTPEFTDQNGLPINNPSGVESFASGIYNSPVNYYSNHIVAFVRSLSGSAVDKPPQDNPLMRQDSFAYRLVAVNAPLAGDTNYPANNPAQTNAFDWQMAANLHEVRLRFTFPLQPSGALGSGDLNFRSLVGGQVSYRKVAVPPFGQTLYYYQSQSFTNAP